MKRRHLHLVRLGLLVTCSLVLWTSQSAQAQRILLHGGDVDATLGDDGDLLAYLQSRYGAPNVMYLRGEDAAADGSSANGFDLVVISSTLSSGTVRSKYDDSPLGVINWEQALVHDNNPGNFFFSDGGADNAVATTPTTQLDILDPTHPIAAGLSGTVDVFNSPQPTMVGTGAIGPGVSLIANRTGNSDHHAIMAADVGDELLGGNIAAGRRVHLFLQDVGFSDLTPDGLALFNAAVDWAAVPEPSTLVLIAVGLPALVYAGRRRRRKAA